MGDKSPDGYFCCYFNVFGYCHQCHKANEHMQLYGFFLKMEDRAGLQITFGHPEDLFYTYIDRDND